MERSAKLKPLLGGKCAREERLCGLSSFPVDFPRILRPLAFSLGIQALGEVSHFTTLIFSFSKLTSKTLLTIWLFSGVDSSVGKLYAEEEFATDIVLDTIITIDLKSNGLQWIVLFDLATKTDSKCTEDGHFIALSGTSLCFDSDIPLPVIFPPKVSPSPTCSCSSFLPLLALHQSDNLPQQTNFFPYFYITQSSLWVETPFQNVPSIQPFSTLPQNIKVVLNSNIDKLGKHSQILPLIISCTLVRLF